MQGLKIGIAHFDISLAHYVNIGYIFRLIHAAGQPSLRGLESEHEFHELNEL